MALLDLKHVSKVYPHANGVLPVLEDVSFTVEEGEFIAIVGPSGCGKSTLVRIINGIVPATTRDRCFTGDGRWMASTSNARWCFNHSRCCRG